MNILWLFDTCGWIIGPAIMLAGVAALMFCIRASLRSATPRFRRITLGVALLPFVLSLVGVAFGFVVAMTAGEPNVAWWALGKTCLAGTVVTALPLIWSLLLLRSGPNLGVQGS